MKIIIPASGVGQRFIDAGYKNTKPLIEVHDGVRIIDYVADSFDIFNDEFYFITSEKTYTEMEEYLSASGLNYKHFLLSDKALGPVDAVLKCIENLKEFIGQEDQVVVSYCDYGMKWDYFDFFDNVTADISIPCYTGFHPHLEPVENVYAVCKSEGNRVYEVIEKYKSTDKYNENWSAGLYYFKTLSIMEDSFNTLVTSGKTLNGEYYVSDAINAVVDKYKVDVYNKIKKFYQFGTPKDFEIAQKNLKMLSDIYNEHTVIKNTVVLSAGKGERFLNLGFNQPKPFLPLSNSDLVSCIKKSFHKIDTDFIFVGSEAHSIFWQNYNVRYVIPNNIGAAYSYKSACGDITGETLIVPCDLIGKHIDKFFDKTKSEAEVIVFTTDPTDFADTNEKSFSWVSSDSENTITSIDIKNRRFSDQKVLIGSFWVRSNETLLEHIEAIFSKELKNNGEYYLDTAFKHMQESGIKVKSINIENYFSLGTPYEYQQSKYWLDGEI